MVGTRWWVLYIFCLSTSVAVWKGARPRLPDGAIMDPNLSFIEEMQRESMLLDEQGQATHKEKGL